MHAEHFAKPIGVDPGGQRDGAVDHAGCLRALSPSVRCRTGSVAGGGRFNK